MSSLFIRSVGVLVVASMLLFPAGALAAPGAPGGTVHIVQWGETLSMVASQYGVTVEAIMAANGLNDPDFVYVGQKLVIPMSGGSYSPDMGMGPSMPGYGGGNCLHYYTVQLGDTLSGIAWDYGTSASALMQANNLASDFIYEGHKLCVPAAAGTSMEHMSQGQASSAYYTVRAGDTLAGIALRFGVTQAAIMQANNLSNPSLIYVDQRLVIPGGYAESPTMSKPMSGDMPGMQPGYPSMGNEGPMRPMDGQQPQMGPGMDGWSSQTGPGMSPESPPGYSPMESEPRMGSMDGQQPQMAPGMDGQSSQMGPGMSPESPPGYSPMESEPRMGSMDGQQPQMAPGMDGRSSQTGPGMSPESPPGYSPMESEPRMGSMDGAPSQMPVMGQAPAPPPDYVPPDGVKAGVAHVEPVWTGSQIAHNADPDGITTLLVLVEEGNEDLDVMIKSSNGFVARGVTGVYYEYSWLPSFAFRYIPGGDYKVWIEGETSKVIDVRVDPGWRATVDMKWKVVSPDPVVSSDGWIAEVVDNTGGSEPVGAFSVLIVRTGATGNKIRLTAPGGFEAVCVTGTKPEHGPGACDFGGLNAGTYLVNLDGTHATVEIFLDGIGTATVEFRPAGHGFAMKDPY